MLAAEEFAVGAGDPALHQEPPHDILAAEMFEVGGADPVLHHGPVTLPPDLTGSDAPRDVLAAEEFAMPAPIPHVFAAHEPHLEAGAIERPGGTKGRARVVHTVLLAGIAAAIAAALSRGRRRRRR